jgi:uncharacterized membrane protein YagU involved in acid resistance
MNLTKKQKKDLGNTAFFTVVAAVLVGLVIWGTVTLLSSPAKAVNTPPVPQVNASRFEQINTSNDNTTDHYCLGKEGFFFGPNSGDFAVIKDDPLCH